MVFKVDSDRIGPVKVELAIYVSCLGYCQARYAPVRDTSFIQ
jgi:hypothetical protein